MMNSIWIICLTCVTYVALTSGAYVSYENRTKEEPNSAISQNIIIRLNQTQEFNETIKIAPVEIISQEPSDEYITSVPNALDEDITSELNATFVYPDYDQTVDYNFNETNYETNETELIFPTQFLDANPFDRCPMFSIPCQNWTSCVHFSRFCDGQKDCLDGSDEEEDYCKKGVAVVVCNNGQLLRGHDFRCNGVSDCDDGSDEVGCFAAENDLSKLLLKPCNWLFQFQCSEDTCIDKSKVCDGFEDCPFGVDETASQCALKTHTSDRNVFGSDTSDWKSKMFVCSNKDIIFTASDARCNGNEECDDGSDESGCDEIYECADGSRIVGQYDIVCDGFSSCPDGSDEAHCDYQEEDTDTRHSKKSGDSKAHTMFTIVTVLLSVSLFFVFVIMISLCRANSNLRKMLNRSSKNQGAMLTSQVHEKPPEYSELFGASRPS